MSRVSVPGLVVLADGMPLHERQIVETVARLTLVSGRQLSQLFLYISNTSTVDTSPPSASSAHARRVRRVLDRLVQQRVLTRLEHRRQGGVGGGSSAWVYALGPVGRRLVAYWAGEGLPRSRSTHEPSVTWTMHTLAVSELYVQLRATQQSGQVELLAFNAEPACWRSYTRLGGGAGCLKPDAYVRLGVGEYEDSFLVEIDLGTEHRGQLTRQHRAYMEHFRSGAEQAQAGIYPAVLWLVPDNRRAQLLAEIQQGLPEAVRRLFTVARSDHALVVLCGESADTAVIGGGA